MRVRVSVGVGSVTFTYPINVKGVKGYCGPDPDIDPNHEALTDLGSVSKFGC